MKKKPPEPSFFQKWQNQFICLAIALAVFAVYSEVSEFQFVNFDDTLYSLNAHNKQGLSLENLKWALTSGEDANWLPVTRVSHIVDTLLFGKSSGPVHVENAWLHLFASLMVFWFLFRATGARWPSAFTALVFAVHPLHVESVAWASERKDVLCAVFWFLTLWAWVAYTSAPSRNRYLRALLLFCLGLMSKPMMVSLPVILVLLDFWPLHRRWSRATLIEKVPFAALSLAACTVTYIYQKAGGAVQSIDVIGLGPRIENALVSWILYPAKTIWPSHLAVFYPIPDWSITEAALCGLAVAAISAAAIWRREKFPWLVTGWFWYLVTTIPVIGIVQVGLQARADRYMYIPMVGLLISLAWAARELIRLRPQARPWIAAAAGVCLVVFAAAARDQASTWQDTETLFRHAIQVTDRNVVAYKSLAGALRNTPGRLPDALAAFRETVKIRPDLAESHADLAGALEDAGQSAEATQEAETALRLDPKLWRAHMNLGNILQHQGKTEQAIAELRIAVREMPLAVEAHLNLGAALSQAGQYQEAIAQEDEALRLDPDNSSAHFDKAGALLKLRNGDAAAVELRAVIAIDPNNAVAHAMLGAVLLATRGTSPEGIAELEAAIRIDPRVTWPRVSLARALAKSGRMDEAIVQIKSAMQLDPDPELGNILKQLETMARGGS